MLKSLKLFLLKPESPSIEVTLQEFFSIQANLIAENTGTCFVSLKYDHNHIQLEEGAEVVMVGGGSFSKEISWILKAIKVSDDSLWTQITAEAENLFQIVGFNINIKKGENKFHEHQV